MARLRVILRANECANHTFNVALIRRAVAYSGSTALATPHPRGPAADNRTMNLHVHFPRPTHRGFTLIELLVAVAIAGILMAIAYPSYMSQVRKSRRSDAVAALARVQQAQERWRANNTTYASSITNLATLETGLTSTSEKGYYSIATAVVAATASSAYTITATAISGSSQASDSGCTTLTVTVASGTTTNTPTSCWSK